MMNNIKLRIKEYNAEFLEQFCYSTGIPNAFSVDKGYIEYNGKFICGFMYIRSSYYYENHPNTEFLLNKLVSRKVIRRKIKLSKI